jgi:hypothetical protein
MKITRTSSRSDVRGMTLYSVLTFLNHRRILEFSESGFRIFGHVPAHDSQKRFSRVNMDLLSV